VPIATGLPAVLIALGAEPYGDLEGLEIRKPEDRKDAVQPSRLPAKRTFAPAGGGTPGT